MIGPKKISQLKRGYFQEFRAGYFYMNFFLFDIRVRTKAIIGEKLNEMHAFVVVVVPSCPLYF